MALRRVVATVTLVGLGPGDPVWADDADPQVARWLRGGQLRALDDPQPEVETSTDGAIVPQAQIETPAAEVAEPQAEVEPRAPRAPRAKK